MKKRIKLLALMIGFQTITLQAESNQEQNVITEVQDSQRQSDEKSKTDVTSNKKSEIKTKTNIIKTPLKPIHLKTTLFVNGRVNEIFLVITNDKNQQFKVRIKAGTQYECRHKAQSLKKVVCYEIATPNTILSQSDLNTHSAFVFNTDQKLEKYHFITIQQKHTALQRASHCKNETLFHEISDYNIYYV